VRSASQVLVQELGREPTDEEIARRSGLSVEETRRMTQLARPPVSLDQFVDDHHLGEIIEDHRKDDPFRDSTQQALRTRIKDVIETLDFREQEIIRLRYGLEDGKSRTLEEVGRIFHVTRERVRQIESRAFKKLRTPTRYEMLADFLDDVDCPKALHRRGKR
jgi:RNA polymerase primary sigma factor